MVQGSHSDPWCGESALYSASASEGYEMHHKGSMHPINLKTPIPKPNKPKNARTRKTPRTAKALNPKPEPLWISLIKIRLRTLNP